MPKPDQLPTGVSAGQLGHPALHNDERSAINQLGDYVDSVASERVAKDEPAALTSRRSRHRSHAATIAQGSRETFGHTFSTGDNWARSAVSTVDGRIYHTPRNATTVLIIDPFARTVVETDYGLDLSSSWWGIAEGADGRLYCAPLNATDVLIIDPRDGTAELTDFGIDLSGDLKWDGIAAARDGRLFCAPLQAGDFLIIDPRDGTATRDTLGLTVSTGASQWKDAVLAPDGRIFAAPGNAGDVLIIDPATDTATRNDFGLTLGGLWNAGSVAGDGRIYFTPRQPDQVLIVDPATDTATLEDFGLDLSEWWVGSAVGPDGKVYCAPRTGSGVLVIDPFEQTAQIDDLGLTMNPSINQWSDIVSAADGNLYCSPREDPTILLVELPAAAPASDAADPTGRSRRLVSEVRQLRAVRSRPLVFTASEMRSRVNADGVTVDDGFAWELTHEGSAGARVTFTIPTEALPDTWDAFEIVFYWANAGSGSGNVRLYAPTSAVGPGEDTTAGTGGTNAVTATAQGEGELVVTASPPVDVPGPGGILTVAPGRFGAGSADTLENPIHLFAVALRGA